MGQAWEFTTQNDMISHLVGKNYDDIDQDVLSKIQEDKKFIANATRERLQVKSYDVGLDLGSGPGFLALEFSKHIKKLHCFDISSSFIEFAKKNCIERPNISFHYGKSLDLSFLDKNSLDFAYSENVFCHLNLYEIDLYLKELSRLLRPNARMLFDFLDFSMIRFTEHAYQNMRELYKKGNSLGMLYNYNSLDSIKSLAHLNDFQVSEVIAIPKYGSYSVLLSKNSN